MSFIKEYFVRNVGILLINSVNSPMPPVKILIPNDPKKVAYLFNEMLPLIGQNPIKYLVESELFLNIIPSPAQRVALKLIYDLPLDPDKLHEFKFEDEIQKKFKLKSKLMTEVEAYELMTEKPYADKPDVTLSNLILIVGRRGGKTLIACIATVSKMVERNWRPWRGALSRVFVALLSHSKEFTAEVMEELKNLCENSPILQHFIDKDSKETVNQFSLKVPFVENGKIINGRLTGGKIDYSKVTAVVGAANKKTIRGKAIVTLICDEIAFWDSRQRAANSDKEIIRAVTPSLLQFKGHALCIKLSSPNTKEGVLYDEWDKWEKGTLPDSYIALKAPSWFWNPNGLSETDFQEQLHLDQENFDREYRANFTDSISAFFKPPYIRKAIMKDVEFQLPEHRSKKVDYMATIDAGFSTDRYVFTVVGYDGDRYTQYHIDIWEPKPDKPVKAFDTAQAIRGICNQFGIDEVFADQFSYQPLSEIFEKYSIKLTKVAFTNTLKGEIYGNLKRKFLDAQIDILDNHIQYKELVELIVERTSTGGHTIKHPDRGHDDASDALALAVYKLWNEHKGEVDGVQVTSASGVGEVEETPKSRFRAPNPQEMAGMFGELGLQDNSQDYEYNEETGKWEYVGGGEDDGFY